MMKGESPSCGEGFEGDLVTEGLELGNGSLASTVGVAADEVVATQVSVVTVVGEQVPGDHQDRVAHGHGGLLLADASGQPPELGRQVAVAAAGCGPGALGQHLPQPAVALVVLPERRLPPVTLLPGQRPARRPGGRRWGTPTCRPRSR